MLGRIVVGALVLLAAAFTFLLATGVLVVPDRWNPFAPLSITEPPNFLTGYKLGRIAGHPERCREALQASMWRYRYLTDRPERDGCGYANAVRIESMRTRLAEPLTLTCESAVALALWERHTLEPGALRHYGSGVARLHHYGSYACRNVNGRENARRSEHASANALDIAGFTLADGREVRVRNGWREGHADAAFLRELRDGACRYFDVVLGPDYNAAHHDHFHFDRGRFRACR